MATHSTVLAWRNPRDWGAWWAAIYGVAQSRTRLKWLSSNSSREELRRTINSPRKKVVAGPKWKQCSVVYVSGDESKIWCCKEQYCIGMWNVRSMNQGKLDVVKQEMVRININILGRSKPKWTGMGEFNSDDHYIYYCGQESHRKNGVAFIINKRVF